MSGVIARAEPLVPDEVTNQMISAPLNTANMDDYLLDMARSTNVNVIADATEFPAESSVIPYPATSGTVAGLKGDKPDHWRSALIIIMNEFAAQKRLSMLRAGARTFLFWSEPDPRQLLELQGELTDTTEAARWAEAIASAQANGVSDDQIIRGKLSDERLRDVLSEYLSDEHGWKGTVAQRNDHVDIQVSIDKLPPDLRALVLFDLRNMLINNWSYKLTQDAYWNTARIHLVDSDDPAIEVTYDIPKKEGEVDTDYNYTLTTLDAANKALTSVPIASMQEPVVTPVQLGPKDTLFNAYSGLSDVAYDSALDADAALQTPISLQVKRLTLRDLLMQLQQKGGPQLTLSEDAPSDKLITARVEKMPLSKLMGVLSRIYGVKWDKTGEAAYQMRGNDQGELHLKLLQMGDQYLYRHRFLFYTPLDRKNEKVAIGKAIIEQVSQEALRKPEGVLISSLPQDLQRRWRYALEDRYAEIQVPALYKANSMLADQLAKKELILRFGNAVSESYRMPLRYHMMESQDIIRFNVQSEDGQLVLPVFNAFILSTAKADKQDVHPPSRRR